MTSFESAVVVNSKADTSSGHANLKVPNSPEIASPRGSLGQLIFVQPALPFYRIDFFKRIAARFGTRLRVYYSDTQMGELTPSRDRDAWEHPLGPVRRLPIGLEWQVGAVSIPVSRGDVVVVCGAPRTISTLLLLLRCRFIGAKTVWWGHFWSATTKPWRHKLRLLIMTLSDATLFYTDSEVTRYKSMTNSKTRIIYALNNGLNLTRIRELRQPYIPHQRGYNLLFIGRLTAKANLKLLLTAMQDRRLLRSVLYVIGSGPEEYPLRQLSKTLGLGDRVKWMGGTVDEVMIAQIANKCSAFVYPGEVGLSLIHGMGYGLPAIVHDNLLRQMPEIAAFSDGFTGLTFRFGDVSSLAETTYRILASPLDRTSMSRHSIDVLENEFNTESMSSRFYNLVTELEN